jgi:hypothetical protein
MLLAGGVPCTLVLHEAGKATPAFSLLKIHNVLAANKTVLGIPTADGWRIICSMLSEESLRAAVGFAKCMLYWRWACRVQGQDLVWRQTERARRHRNPARSKRLGRRV